MGVVDDAALPSLELDPAAARKALTSLNGVMHVVGAARLRDVQVM